MINHPFQHLQYETKVTGFFLVHVEISVTKETNGRYIESHDFRRNKGNEKKNLGHLFPCYKRNDGKVNDPMINHPFQHLQYETKVTDFSWSM